MNLCFGVTNLLVSALFGISSISGKNIGHPMNSNFPDRSKSTDTPRDRVFDDLREGSRRKRSAGGLPTCLRA